MVGRFGVDFTEAREVVGAVHGHYVRSHDGVLGIRRTGDARLRDGRVGRTARGARVPLNAALEGKTYPVVPFEVTEDHVRRFAAAVGDDGAFVPPTFVTAPEIPAGLSQAVADTELGLDFARVVHREQEYAWTRPLRVGETLDVRSTIESIRSKGGLEMLTLRTEMRGEDGETAVVARSSMIVRGGS